MDRKMTDIIQLDSKERERISKVRGHVDATDNERHMLWERYSKDGQRLSDFKTNRTPVTWVEESDGYFFQIGKLADMPVTLMLNFATIDGFYTMFWNSPSMVVDHRLVEKFLKTYMNPCVWHTDATNFHNLILDYRRANEKCLADMVWLAY